MGRCLLGWIRLPVSPWLLVVSLAIPFVYYAFALGATFWIDGFCYSGLAASFADSALFREFNSGWGRLSLGHLQPGVAVLCWALDFLPDDWQWPVLVCLQRSLALAALSWCVLEATKYRPTLLDIFLCSLLVWNPFYQSFHNSLLTESLASSLLLLVVGSAFAMSRSVSHPWRYVMLGGISLAIVANVRSYLGLAALLVMLVAAWSLKGSSRWCACLAFLACASVSAFVYPTVRFLASGEWFMPANNMAYLLAAGWGSSGGGKNFSAAVESLPETARPHCGKLANPDSDFDYADAKLLIQSLLEHGYTSSEVSQTLRFLADALNKDNTHFTEARLRKAAISCGFVALGCAGDDIPTMRKGWPSQKYARHQSNVVKYHAWFWGADQFRNFFETPSLVFVAASEGQDWFVRTHKKYIRQSVGWQALDPLRLIAWPLDVWAVAGVCSIIILLWPPVQIRGIILLMPLIVNFGVMASVPLANPRYAYSLLPVYLIAFLCASSKLSMRSSPPRVA